MTHCFHCLLQHPKTFAQGNCFEQTHQHVDRYLHLRVLGLTQTRLSTQFVGNTFQLLFASAVWHWQRRLLEPLFPLTIHELVCGLDSFLLLPHPTFGLLGTLLQQPQLADLLLRQVLACIFCHLYIPVLNELLLDTVSIPVDNLPVYVYLLLVLL